jgi:hypothetical protein
MLYMLAMLAMLPKLNGFPGYALWLFNLAIPAFLPGYAG